MIKRDNAFMIVNESFSDQIENHWLPFAQAGVQRFCLLSWKWTTQLPDL